MIRKVDYEDGIIGARWKIESKWTRLRPSLYLLSLLSIVSSRRLTIIGLQMNGTIGAEAWINSSQSLFLELRRSDDERGFISHRLAGWDDDDGFSVSENYKDQM